MFFYMNNTRLPDGLQSKVCVTIVGTSNSIYLFGHWWIGEMNDLICRNDVMKIMIRVHILPGISDQSGESSFM